MKKSYQSLLPQKEAWSKFQRLTYLNQIPKPKGPLPKLIKRIYFKNYPRFRQTLLPALKPIDKNLVNIFLKRKTHRAFKKNKPTLSELSSILFFSAGINPYYLKKNFQNRFYPSAGARYPLEVYLITQNHKDLGFGFYHYNVENHSLETLPFEKKDSLDYIGQGNILLKDATVFVVITAIFNRTTVKYGTRGYRYVYLEAGHVMQNVYLLATALGLSCCAIGGFVDKNINQLLDLELNKEQTLYMCALG